MHIGFGGILALLFIAFKLTNVIAWSWLWVLSPLWLGVAVAVVVALIAITYGKSGAYGRLRG